MNCILVAGPPASGKSSLTQELVNQGYTSLNRDTEGGTIAGLLPKMEALLKQNKKIVLDNLFPTKEIRKPFIELSKKYNSDISCMVMGTTIEEAQFNFVQRAFKLINEFPTPEAIKKAKHPNIFPPAVFFKFRKEFEKPTTAEGFSSVETVKFTRQHDPNFKQAALILDYDGTLRECVGGNGKYPTAKEHIKILPNRTGVLRSYRDKGYLLLGCSNQSGIAKGTVSNETVKELFDYTNTLLATDIDVRYCPHQSAPISCYCRKPMSGIWVEFMLKYKLDASKCLFVGDYGTDKGFAQRSGIEYIDQAEFFKE